MATLNGNLNDIITGVAFSQSGRFVTEAGVDATPHEIQTYFMAAFDNLGNRYFWENQTADFTGAPTPTGSFVTSSLVIEGRV
jgi:hypothetical protein